MPCPHCKEKINICPYCEYGMYDESLEEFEKCPKCGTEIDRCPHCGCSLYSNFTPIKETKAVKFIRIVCITLLVIGVIYLIYYDLVTGN